MLASYLIRRLSGDALVTFVHKILPLLLLIRAFLTRKEGQLVMVLCLYFYLRCFSDSPPFTPGELLLWFESLDKELKAGVTSGLLTILGFLTAYHVASIGWKPQAVSSLRLQANSDLEDFFNELTDQLFTLRNYADLVIEAVELYRSGDRTHRTYFLLNRISEQFTNYIEARDKIGRSSTTIYRLKNRHGFTLAGLPAGNDLLTEVIERLQTINKTIWFIVPELTDPTQTDQFVDTFRLESYRSYLVAFEENFLPMSASLGAIQGLIFQPILGFNFGNLAMTEINEEAKEGLKKWRQKRN